LQKTGGEIVGWYQGGVTRESGVTYFVEITRSSNGAVVYSGEVTGNQTTIDVSAITLNELHTLKIWSVRGGLSCSQPFAHNFRNTALVAPSNIGFEIIEYA
jgi:hypothetical protein